MRIIILETIKYTKAQCAKRRLREQIITHNRDDSIAWLQRARHWTVHIQNVYVEQHD